MTCPKRFDRSLSCMYETHQYITDTSRNTHVLPFFFDVIRACMTLLKLICFIHAYITDTKRWKVIYHRFFSQHTHTSRSIAVSLTHKYNTLQHTVTRCIELQPNAIHCKTLQHAATYCDTMKHTATHCNILQHIATHCSILRHTTTPCNILQHHGITLHHAATHCNTL